MNAQDLISAARLRVNSRHPYVSAVLFSLRPKPLPGLGTVAVTNSWVLLYDPDVIQVWGVGEKGHDGLAAALAHEVWHCLFQHFDRQQGREAKAWNRASDREINDDIVKAGWRFPGQPLLPKDVGKPDGETAEVYYDAEKKPATQVKLLIPGCGGKCGGCSGNPHAIEAEHDKSHGRDEADEQGEGSARGGTDAALSSGPGGLSSAEQEILRRQVAQEVQAAANRRADNIPAGLVAWAEKQLEPPTIDWRKQLAALVRQTIASKAGVCDYSYQRPARRQWAMRGLMRNAPILPALRAPVPTVKGVLDVSESMAGDPAMLARSEIVGVCKALGSPVEWVACDVQVAARAKVSSVKDIGKLRDTQGGTDLRTGILDLDRLRPDIICVITDGFTAWPERSYVRAKVIAAITPDGQIPPDHIPHVMIGKK